MFQGDRLILSEEVHDALSTSKPIVALESAIITHGMPHPTNYSTANSLEKIIRSKGSIPATIALINGKVHVGLTESELIQLSDPQSKISQGAVKVSRRDLGPVISLEKTGGTTVAGTMYVAESLGIKVFVTGGIGGVHRGAESTMDISADLLELGRTPMAVFCAGAKSILDIPRTLEVLETQGVCVASYGDKQDFPAFYTPSSGCQSPWRVGDADAAARLIYTQLSLPIKLATLLGVPIPSEHAEAGAEVQKSVEQAVRESVELGIDKRGKEVTPWLLKRVGELTGGKALGLNVNLIENNARIGAEVAVKLSEMYKLEAENGKGDALRYLYSPPNSHSPHKATIASTQLSQAQNTSSPTTTGTQETIIPTQSSKSTVIPTPTSEFTLPRPTVLVFGSAAIDLTSTSPHTLEPRTTTPGTVFVSPGGVGRNIAEAAQNLLPDHAVQLISAFGTNPSDIASSHHHDQIPSNTLITSGENVEEPDSFGKLLMLELAAAGLRTDGLVGKSGKSTAVCSLTLEKNGDLVAGVADMGIVETLSPDSIEEIIRERLPRMVVFDCNLTENVIRAILKTCGELSIPTFCDPTSLPKIPRLSSSLLSLLPSSLSDPRPLTNISPNILELDHLYNLIGTLSERSDELESRSWEYINSLNLGYDWRGKLESFLNGEGREWIREKGIVPKMIRLLPFISSFWLKVSSKGLIHLELTSSPSSTGSEGKGDGIIYKIDNAKYHPEKHLVLKHYPPPDIDQDEIVSTTGAGDTLVGGLVAGLVDGQSTSTPQDVWVGEALQGVKRSLKSRRAVG
uniref:Indigoidine synthase A family protein n=1 Tax=Kwoniella bestiolae CBS 10118 TaxID=1296100 RepID=A0A1B9GDH0_9TREE|nr:indigoidine synthase A family protein [Kwoniella bestiolae CBS 10118]OCF29072.1 indigoidine synthase A family protein [Kwoniella bestiolae CBS 10118]